MNLIRCDQCKKELLENAHRFFRTESGGVDTRMFSEHPGPWHFCSWRCMSEYAHDRDDVWKERISDGP